MLCFGESATVREARFSKLLRCFVSAFLFTTSGAAGIVKNWLCWQGEIFPSGQQAEVSMNLKRSGSWYKRC
eukprot:s3625_g7.t1